MWLNNLFASSLALLVLVCLPANVSGFGIIRSPATEGSGWFCACDGDISVTPDQCACNIVNSDCFNAQDFASDCDRYTDYEECFYGCGFGCSESCDDDFGMCSDDCFNSEGECFGQCEERRGQCFDTCSGAACAECNNINCSNECSGISSSCRAGCSTTQTACIDGCTQEIALCQEYDCTNRPRPRPTTEPAPTPEPTPGPPGDAPAPGGGVNGDPHIQSWTGDWYNYMGQCDLKLAYAPLFDGHQDLHLHARTTLRYDYSFIESAAVRIGEDTLEVSSWGTHTYNGVTDALSMDAANTNTMGGYPIYHHTRQVTPTHTKHFFDIVLSPTENVTISNHKDIVNLEVRPATPQHFGQVSGLMGNYQGQLMGRDGKTVFAEEDMDAFGQEWQVRDDEPMLFQYPREPQYPNKCMLPDANAKEARRLGEGVTETQAKVACARLRGAVFENCVYDVTATNDLEQAGAY